MKYFYAPGSAAAHDRAAALHGPAPAPTHAVLESLEIPIAEAPTDARRIAHKVLEAGGWARCVRAHAEDLATCSLIESVSLRVRLAGVGGYAMWRDGRAAGASVITPYRKRLTHEGLEVALGLLVIEYGRCARCGLPDIRLKADGTVRAHKTPQGGKCA